ncbi:MAG: GNAT family N-acetyltransferase [Rikenellaceae bacterium]|nr:GNAT family N-acetyltransferase [Rikenellaceae bacterium]
MTLAGKKVRLRALEPSDVELLYGWENDTRLWEVSETTAPYSRETLRQFIENQQYDIYRTRQQRFVICRLAGNAPVGMIDLFDFDPRNLRAGVGIVICDEASRHAGYATEALELLCSYASKALNLRGLYATVGIDNTPSIQLFRSCGFTEVGTLRDWSRTENGWRDEYFFQKLL